MLGAWPLAEGRVPEDAAAAEVASVSWEDGQLALVHFPRAWKIHGGGFPPWWVDLGGLGVPDLGLPFPFPSCLSWPLALGSGFALSFDFLSSFPSSFPFGAMAALVEDWGPFLRSSLILCAFVSCRDSLNAVTTPSQRKSKVRMAGSSWYLSVTSLSSGWRLRELYAQWVSISSAGRWWTENWDSIYVTLSCQCFSPWTLSWGAGSWNSSKLVVVDVETFAVSNSVDIMFRMYLPRMFSPAISHLST